MKRYLQVLQLFLRTAIAAELEYRLNFILSTISSCGSLLGSLFGLFLFYRTGYEFEGWSWHESLVILGVFTLLQGFSATVLVPNLDRIVTHVREGTLDFILLKPISSQFWLSTRTVSPWGLPDFILGCIIIGYAGRQLKLEINDYFLSLIPLFFGIISLYSLWFILGSMSIWFVKISNVTEVLTGLLEAGRFPMVAYPTVYRFFFTFIVPVAFLTTIPAETLLGRTEVTWVVGSGILALILFCFSAGFWQFALRFYTSASS